MTTFAANSHPEDRGAALATTPPAQPEKINRAKPFNAELRDRLCAYQAEHNLSNNALARELATNPTAVSKYLNGKPEGDVAALEAMIEDVLKGAVRRTHLGIQLFETSITKQINGYFETVRRTNSCGIIHGEAGLGKTAGAALYMMSCPSALMIELRGWNADKSGVQSMLFATIENRTWNGYQRRADFMADRLRGSKRLIVVDNAHKLTTTARAWLLDFHDETKCPLILLGRSGIVKEMRKEREQMSYIGFVAELKFKGDEAEAAASLIRQIDPAAAEVIAQLGAKVVERPGHLRALKNQVTLAQDLRSSPQFADKLSDSFSAAHLLSGRDYTL